jgi:hypothetical protein
MLADFQQALAAIAASPDYCASVRDDPAVLEGHYRLTPRERRRLGAIAAHPGMNCTCGLYRVNRATPLALSLPATLEALGADLEPLLTAYWQDHPRGLIHFVLECERFCTWLRRRSVVAPLAEAALPALRREEAVLRHELARVGFTSP